MKSLDGSGVATLMADACLTNGAFYAHFKSKDDPIAAAVAEELGRQRESFITQVGEPGGLEPLVRSYLSVEHRDNPDQGCPSAALLVEIGHCTDATKQAYTEGLLAVIDAIAAQLAPHDPAIRAGADPQCRRHDVRNTAALSRPDRPRAG